MTHKQERKQLHKMVHIMQDKFSYPLDIYLSYEYFPHVPRCQTNLLPLFRLPYSTASAKSNVMELSCAAGEDLGL